MDFSSWLLIAILAGQPFPVGRTYPTIGTCFDAGDKITAVYVDNLKRFPSAKPEDDRVRIPKFTCIPVGLDQHYDPNAPIPEAPKPPQ